MSRRHDSEVEYLDLEGLLGLTRVLNAGPVRDLGLLDSVCARPHSSTFGADAYPTLEEKAAALLHSLARSDALLDGDKRLAWLATVVFLTINSRTVELDDDARRRGGPAASARPPGCVNRHVNGTI